jgi:uncharacterized membrane protein YqiK
MLLTIGILLVIVMVIATVAFVMFFKRSTKELAFVRTGLGGEKVFSDNGGFVFPILHDKINVNMSTLKIIISRGDEQSLITKDRTRINVNSEFFLRVEPNHESIARAAQALGQRTLYPDQLKEQVEGRCVDALRRAASVMDMQDMHDKRSEFGRNVEEGVKTDLAKMGLMLESVALTQLNQTDLKFFNTDNAFDVQGLTYIKQQIADNLKRQNEVENNKQVAIKQGDLEAHNKQLEIEKQEAFADQQQQKAIEEAKILVDRQIEEARIQTAIELQEARRKESRAKAEAERSIAEAWIEADEVKARAATKREEIITAQEKAQADRNRLVEVISAEKEADRQRIFATAQADAEVREAGAAKVRFEVEAEGKTALNLAANQLSDKQIAMQVKTKIVSQLPEIIRESVRPLENIDGIKIMQVDGFSNVVSRGGGAGGSGGALPSGSGGNGGGGSLADQVVDSALRYRAQAPMVESLLNEIGLTGTGIKDLTKSLQREMNPKKNKGGQELGNDEIPPDTDMTGLYRFGSSADPEIKVHSDDVVPASPPKPTGKTSGDD